MCEREGLDFTYKELNKDFTRENLNEKFPGAKTFPQIQVDGENIGGYTELAARLGKTPDNSGQWIGVGTAIGAAVFAATNEPVWIAVGVAIGAALSLRKPE
jgi:glutaredoxin